MKIVIKCILSKPVTRLLAEHIRLSTSAHEDKVDMWYPFVGLTMGRSGSERRLFMKQWAVDIVASLAPRAFSAALGVRLVHFRRTDWINLGIPTHTMCYISNDEEAEQEVEDEPETVPGLECSSFSPSSRAVYFLKPGVTNSPLPCRHSSARR